MIEFKNKVIIVTKFNVIDGGHKHDLCYCKFLNPLLISFDSQQISAILFICLFRVIIRSYVINLHTWAEWFSKGFDVVLRNTLPVVYFWFNLLHLILYLFVLIDLAVCLEIWKLLEDVSSTNQYAKWKFNLVNAWFSLLSRTSLCLNCLSFCNLPWTLFTTSSEQRF